MKALRATGNTALEAERHLASAQIMTCGVQVPSPDSRDGSSVVSHPPGAAAAGAGAALAVLPIKALAAVLASLCQGCEHLWAAFAAGK